ncbi:MAG: hypothetical protein ACYTG7_24145 [Planctomycetota bacterium]|jgi:hypothetical protein
MTSHRKVLRETAFQGLAALYPDLHRLSMTSDDVDQVLLRASDDLARLRAREKLFLAVVDAGCGNCPGSIGGECRSHYCEGCRVADALAALDAYE